MTSRVGFLGLGVMGQPMALNLRGANVPLVVWNRTPGRTDPLRLAGATVAADPDEVFETAEVVFVMLANSGVVDQVLGRGTSRFAALVRGRTLVSTGTVAPAYSAGLGDDVRRAGGRYVEAPVSGSRVPAETAQLVGMLAGETEALGVVRPLMDHMCRQTFVCGAPPSALLMKLAVNLYLITMVTGLAEAAHFAEAHGLDLQQFAEVVAAGPMASHVSTMKLAKLLEQDFSVQASIADVLMNNTLVAEAATASDIAAPLILACRELYAAAERAGHGSADMIAVIRALEDRTSMLRDGGQPVA